MGSENEWDLEHAFMSIKWNFCTDTMEYTLRWASGGIRPVHRTLRLVLGEAYMWIGIATLGRSAEQTNQY